MANNTNTNKIDNTEHASGGYGAINASSLQNENTTSFEIIDDTPSLKKELIAEVFGTCMLTQIGCAGWCVHYYLHNISGMWQVGVIWAVGSTIAFLSTAGISGAHLNPAVTLSFALVRRDEFPWRRVLPYVMAQFLGAFLAGWINLFLFHTAIRRFEKKHGLKRGTSDAIASAAAFGDYWSLNKSVDNSAHAFFIEAFITGFLVFVIFTMTHSRNPLPSVAVPPTVGFTVGLLVALYGSMTGAGLNPARDLGPRLVTLCAGWGPASMTNFGVYLLAPLIGGPIGAFLADRVLNVD